MSETVSVTYLGRELSISRVTFRDWVTLTAIQRNMKSDFADGVLKYLKVATKLDWSNLSWTETLQAFMAVYHLNSAKFLPRYLTVSEIAADKLGTHLDYPEREFFSWASLFFEQYGWSLEYVASLSIEDALAITQELLYNRQIEQEWQWGLSENSIGYDETTKKSVFNPLERPAWMKPDLVPAHKKVVRIPKSLMPQGNIVGINEKFSNSQ